jgi:hypothetical protein
MSADPKSYNQHDPLRHNDSSSIDSEKQEHEEVITPPAQAGPPAPPNGGLKAWLAVAGGFLFVLNSWYVKSRFNYCRKELTVP